MSGTCEGFDRRQLTQTQLTLSLDCKRMVPPSRIATYPPPPSPHERVSETAELCWGGRAAHLGEKCVHVKSSKQPSFYLCICWFVYCVSGSLLSILCLSCNVHNNSEADINMWKLKHSTVEPKAPQLVSGGAEFIPRPNHRAKAIASTQSHWPGIEWGKGGMLIFCILLSVECISSHLLQRETPVLPQETDSRVS